MQAKVFMSNWKCKNTNFLKIYLILEGKFWTIKTFENFKSNLNLNFSVYIYIFIKQINKGTILCKLRKKNNIICLSEKEFPVGSLGPYFRATDVMAVVCCQY